MIRRGGERGSGISILVARQDDDDDDNGETTKEEEHSPALKVAWMHQYEDPKTTLKKPKESLITATKVLSLRS